MRSAATSQCGPARPGRSVGGGLARRAARPRSERPGWPTRRRPARRGRPGWGCARSSSSSCGLGVGQLGVELLDPRAGIGRGLAEGRDLRAVGRGAAADGLADLLGGGVALGLEPVRVAQQLAAPAVERQGGIDDRRVLALVDRALPDPIRLFAQPGQPDAHAIATPWCPPAAAGRARVRVSLAWRVPPICKARQGPAAAPVPEPSALSPEPRAQRPEVAE